MRAFLAWIASLVLILAACTPDSMLAEEEDTSRIASDLPISRVVLYRSGIAYIERQGTVEGNRLTLQIEPQQINDILTTLTVVVDRGENIASSIGLPIERTTAADLSNLPPQVRQQGGMLALLEAFRGADVHLETATDSVDGRVVGTETLTNDEGNQIRRVTIMTEEGVLRQFRVDDVTNVELQNHALQVGLAKSLDVSLGEGDWKSVELTLRLTGEPPHEVFVSYVVEMPTWKPSYRIVIDDERARLQGWAVIDNVSGEDWRNVDLSLVAGTPISFRYDLHTPRFVSRPDLTSRGFADELNLVAPNIDRGVRTPEPQAAAGYYEQEEEVRDEGGEAYGERERSRRSSGGFGRSGANAAPADMPATEQQVQLDMEMMVGSLAESAASEELDSLFRYDLRDPVTVQDRGSALVSIINEPLDGEDVLYFDPSTPSPAAANTPYRAVRLHNDTGYTVERGPLAIFKDATFVGEAISPRIGEEEMIFLPYSLDARFRISQRQSTGEEGVRLVRIVNSVIYSEVQRINRRTYQITNNSGDPVRLYVRVPKQTNWNLRLPDPLQTEVIDQGDVWFVPVGLSGDISEEFVVEEATTVTRSVEIWSNLAADTIGLYLSRSDVNPELAATLQTVLEQRNRMAEIDRELQRVRRLRSEVYERMNEVRQNLEILGDSRQSRDLRQQLEERLGNLEEEATSHTVQVVSLEEEESELRARINTTLMDLSLEAPSSDDAGTEEEGDEPSDD